MGYNGGMENKERNKQIVETEIAKEEFLKKLADLDLTTSHVINLLDHMRHEVWRSTEDCAKGMKFSDILSRKVVSADEGAYGKYPYECQ